MAVVPVVLIVLSLLGWMISLYFTLVYYKRIPADVRWVPPFCRLAPQTCLSLLATPYARLLGFPNSLAGLAYTFGIMIWSVGAVWNGSAYALDVVRIVSLAAVLFSGILFYGLVWRLRTPCPLCFTGQAINVVIAVGVWTI